MARDARNYNPRSADVFGRVQRFVSTAGALERLSNQALTPGGVPRCDAACGVELVQVLAARDGAAVGRVHVSIHG